MFSSCGYLFCSFMYMVIFQVMWICIKFCFVHNKLKAEIACFVMQRPNHYDNIKQNMIYETPPTPQPPTKSDKNRAVQPKKKARDLKFRFRKYVLFAYAKTQALISFTVTAQLICVFVFAYAKSRFSHDRAHMMGSEMPQHLVLFCLIT